MFRKKRRESDFSAEIEAHIQHEYERLREQGMSEEEAQAEAEARRAFGNVTRAEEHFYESGRLLWWDHFWQDVRLSFRLLRKNPGFTAVAVLTLALGIGTNTAIFSVLSTVLLRPLPYKDPAQLMDIWRYNPKENVAYDQMSYPDFQDLRSQNDVLDGMAAFYERRGIVLTGRGDPEHLHGTVCSSSLLDVLGVSPMLGRGLRLAMVGTALGLGAAFGLARLMASLLFGVSATDPATFAGVAGILMVVAMAACYIPARRAMRVDPVVALRHE